MKDRGPVAALVAGLSAGWFLALLASLFLVHSYRGAVSSWRPDPLAPGELAIEVLAAAIGAFWGTVVAARLTNVSLVGAAALGAGVGFIHGLFSVAWHTPPWFWPVILLATMAAAVAGARIFRTELAPRAPARPVSFGEFIEGTGQTKKIRATNMLIAVGTFYFGISLSSRETDRALLGLAVALAGLAGQWALLRCPRCRRPVITTVGMAIGIPRGPSSLAACPHCAFVP